MRTVSHVSEVGEDGLVRHALELNALHPLDHIVLWWTAIIQIQGQGRDEGTTARYLEGLGIAGLGLLVGANGAIGSGSGGGGALLLLGLALGSAGSLARLGCVGSGGRP